MKEPEQTEECEGCGEKDYNVNWMPEGQCYCDECAAEYWVKEFCEELEGNEDW